jgi:hypothetical protein
VIDHQLCDHAKPEALCFGDEPAEILHRPEIGIDAAVVGNVVAVVAAGARVERQQPQCCDAQIVQVVEPIGQAREVADPVAIAVGEGLDVQLIDDRVPVPELIMARFAIDANQRCDIHDRSPSCVAAEQQGGILRLVDAQA